MWEEMRSGGNSKVGLLSEYNYRKTWRFRELYFHINCSLNGQCGVLVLLTS